MNTNNNNNNNNTNKNANDNVTSLHNNNLAANPN